MQNPVHPGTTYEGSRIGVLLIHGLTGTPTEMLPVGRQLHKYGFTVHCPVLAGHCGTKEDLLATTWKDWADSVERAFRTLGERTDVVFAAGLSAGTVLALHLAAQFPGQVRGLGLYSTTLKWDGWSIPKLSFLLPLVLCLPYFGKRYNFFETFPHGIKNDRLRRRIVAQMQSGDAAAAGYEGTPGTSVRELWRMVDVVKKHLGEIETPSLLVHSANDDVASVRNALYVQKHLAGPTELLRLYDSYHMVTVDQERHKVAGATANFFHRQLCPEEKAELAGKARESIPSRMPDGGDKECGYRSPGSMAETA